MPNPKKTLILRSFAPGKSQSPPEKRRKEIKKGGG